VFVRWRIGNIARSAASFCSAFRSTFESPASRFEFLLVQVYDLFMAPLAGAAYIQSVTLQIPHHLFAVVTLQLIKVRLILFSSDVV